MKTMNITINLHQDDIQKKEERPFCKSNFEKAIQEVLHGASHLSDHRPKTETVDLAPILDFLRRECKSIDMVGRMLLKNESQRRRPCRTDLERLESCFLHQSENFVRILSDRIIPKLEQLSCSKK